jgi:hypothetical protein
MLMSIKIMLFWDVTQCTSSVNDGYQFFEGPHSLRLQGKKNISASVFNVDLSWRWRQQFLPNRWCPSTRLRGVTFKKTLILIYVIEQFYLQHAVQGFFWWLISLNTSLKRMLWTCKLVEVVRFLICIRVVPISNLDWDPVNTTFS